MNINDLCFLDFETRALPGVSPSDGSVKTAGTYRYAKRSFAIILTYAIGEGPVRIVAMDRGFKPQSPNFGPEYRMGADLPLPLDLRRHMERVERGEAWLAAWNMGFDRQAWNEGTLFEPKLQPEHVIDVMAQAVASNLPAALEGASRFIGRGGKQDDGKKLIELFCSSNGATPQSHPVEWERFKSYAIRDTDELREVFKATRQLSMEEWAEYWASERINDRGMLADIPFCERASKVAAMDIARTNALIRRYTNGQIDKVTQHQKLADWVWDSLAYSEARNMLISEYDEEAGDVVEVKLSLERSRVSKLITFFQAKEKAEGGLSERDDVILKVLQLREFGASATPKKFDKILAQHDEGSIRGGYVWNGAAQTGRFSSKGVQIHNLTRAVLGKKGSLEPVAIEMINDLEVCDAAR